MFDEALFEERLRNFQPEPLVSGSVNTDETCEITAVTEDANTVDLAKVNYLNFLNNEEIKKNSEDTIRKYGMGSCGPRAFYGTTDLHLELEHRLAKFIGMEASSVFAYGFVTLSTAFSFFFGEYNTVFIDEKLNFPIQQSLKVGRSKTVIFAHNDAKDFRQKVLQEIQQGGSPINFILIIEAISWNTGKLCPLPDFLALTNQLKMRLFLEESYSLGVLGATGRGLTEYYNVDPKKVDFIFGTLEGAFGSIGGFVASGTEPSMGVLQLRSAGFTYSASLPPYLATVVLKGLDLLEDKPEKFSRLAREFHAFFKDECGFNVVSDPQCPFKLIRNKPQENQKVHQFCKEAGVHFICSENGLIVNLNISLLEDTSKLEKVYKTFREASKLIN